MIRHTKLLLALTILLPALAAAQAPLRSTLGFSARIADNGRPVTGSHAFVFSFWKVETGGDPTLGTGDLLWTESQTLTVNDGVVAAALGADATTPNLFPAGLFDGSDRWLEVSVDGVVFASRMAVRAVPYAMTAGAVDWSGVSGKPNFPKVAYASKATTATLTPATCTNYTSVSITVPGPGTVVLDGNLRVVLNHQTATYDYGYYDMGTTTSACGDYNSAVFYAYSDPVGWYNFVLPLRRFFTVAGAGTYTYYLNVNYYYQATSSSASVLSSTMSATFFPN